MSGIYIHIPFCTRKCFYCDFYSVTETEQLDTFVETLCKEIELTSRHSNSKISPETIFIGGGTPSILTPKQLERIIDTLNKEYDLSELKEFSIESNPGTLNEDKLRSYLQLGINRLSIGVQSLDDAELKFLQRVHSSAQAIDNIELARRVGFSNINADIIFSLPGQKWHTLENTIDRLIDTNIEHISAYSLIYEEGTGLHNALLAGKVAKNEDESEADIYIQMIDKFANTGHKQYEISNFSIQGYECLHNLNYWRRKEYLGFGPAAHSFIDGVRYNNISDIHQYIDTVSKSELPIINTEKLNSEDIINEVFYLSLRAEGLDLAKLKSEFEIDLMFDKHKLINKMLIDKKAYIENQILKLTPSGYAICDYLSVILSENY